jgi:hypothetical protein
MPSRSREREGWAQRASHPDAGPPASASPRAHRRHRRRAEPGEVAHFAAFVRQSDDAYEVRDLEGLEDGDLVLVPKHYAVAEPFPVTNGRKAPGARLLRWSGYALLAAVCSGVGGIVFGALVTLIATVQLQRFSRRVRRWRRQFRRANGSPTLPSAASAERLRLLTAWVQGMFAVVIGALLLALVMWRLW